MAARAGARAAMASYSSLDGIPCHAHRELLTGLMREEYGFRGLIEGCVPGMKWCSFT
jgi:beta-glucosidase